MITVLLFVVAASAIIRSLQRRITFDEANCHSIPVCYTYRRIKLGHRNIAHLGQDWSRARPEEVTFWGSPKSIPCTQEVNPIFEWIPLDSFICSDTTRGVVMDMLKGWTNLGTVISFVRQISIGWARSTFTIRKGTGLHSLMITDFIIQSRL